MDVNACIQEVLPNTRHTVTTMPTLLLTVGQAHATLLKTPYQFLLHRRVERAHILMRDHRTSLTEVALASGFTDQHHLARVSSDVSPG